MALERFGRSPPGKRIPQPDLPPMGWPLVKEPIRALCEDNTPPLDPKKQPRFQCNSHEEVGRLSEEVGKLPEEVGRLVEEVGKFLGKVGRLVEQLLLLSEEVGKFAGKLSHQRPYCQLL